MKSFASLLLASVSGPLFVLALLQGPVEAQEASECSGCELRHFSVDQEWGQGKFSFATTFGSPPTAGTADLYVVVQQLTESFVTSCGADGQTAQDCSSQTCEMSVVITLTSDSITGSAGDFVIGIAYDLNDKFLDHGDDTITTNDYLDVSSLQDDCDDETDDGIDYTEVLETRCGADVQETDYQIQVARGQYNTPSLHNLQHVTMFITYDDAEFTVKFACKACDS